MTIVPKKTALVLSRDQRSYNSHGYEYRHYNRRLCLVQTGVRRTALSAAKGVYSILVSSPGITTFPFLSILPGTRKQDSLGRNPSKAGFQGNSPDPEITFATLRCCSINVITLSGRRNNTSYEVSLLFLSNFY